MRALITLLLVACGQAQATEFQIEAGQCRFGLQTDGTFYQSNLYTRNYMTPRCTSLGLADNFKAGPFGWRIAVLWTGQIEARDNIATFFDADAFQSGLTCNNTPGTPGFARGCLVNVNAHGHTWGISFAGTYEQRFAVVTVMLESGFFFFRHSFHSHATHKDCTNCRYINDYDESSGPFTNPSPLLGVTFKVGHIYFAARHYWPAEHRALSLTDHSFTQLSTGLVVKY
jgi:hypothetical protein